MCSKTVHVEHEVDGESFVIENRDGRVDAFCLSQGGQRRTLDFNKIPASLREDYDLHVKSCFNTPNGHDSRATKSNVPSTTQNFGEPAWAT